jgi:hypothetical protein
MAARNYGWPGQAFSLRAHQLGLELPFMVEAMAQKRYRWYLPWRYSSDGRATAAMTKATAAMQKSKSSSEEREDSPSRLIDARIQELSDWRGETLARIRDIIQRADPDVVEEWNWRGVPVWSHAGIICTGETYKSVVKMTFAKGASLEDSSGLFNSSLDGNTRRAIDIREGDTIDEEALKALVRAAVALNTSSAPKRPRRASARSSA